VAQGRYPVLSTRFRRTNTEIGKRWEMNGFSDSRAFPHRMLTLYNGNTRFNGTSNRTTKTTKPDRRTDCKTIVNLLPPSPRVYLQSPPVHHGNRNWPARQPPLPLAVATVPTSYNAVFTLAITAVTVVAAAESPLSWPTFPVFSVCAHCAVRLHSCVYACVVRTASLRGVFELSCANSARVVAVPTCFGRTAWLRASSSSTDDSE